MSLTIKTVRESAIESGKKLVYNRSTGEYQITHGFDSSCGELPIRNQNGKLELSENQLKKLFSYV